MSLTFSNYCTEASAEGHRSERHERDALGRTHCGWPALSQLRQAERGRRVAPWEESSRTSEKRRQEFCSGSTRAQRDFGFRRVSKLCLRTSIPTRAALGAIVGRGEAAPGMATHIVRGSARLVAELTVVGNGGGGIRARAGAQ